MFRGFYLPSLHSVSLCALQAAGKCFESYQLRNLIFEKWKNWRFDEKIWKRYYVTSGNTYVQNKLQQLFNNFGKEVDVGSLKLKFQLTLKRDL